MKLRPTGPIFGLTLRGMLVITALLAVGFAFVGTKVKRARQEQRIADQVVRTGGSVTRLTYGMDGPQPRTWFERFVGLDLEARINTANLHGPEVTDAELADLALLDGLVSLSLSGTSIDGAGFAALADLPELHTVQLSDNSRMTEKGFAALASLPRLEHLALEFQGITPKSSMTPSDAAGLRALGDIKSLTTLHLQGRQVSDESLRGLQSLRRLEFLYLYNTSVTDEGLAAVADKMPAIQWLKIVGGSLTGEGAIHLQRCERLINLDIYASPLTDAGLMAITQLRGLQALNIDAGPAVTPAGVRLIGNLTNLQVLRLHNLGFSDEATSGLSGLTLLQTLSLDATNVRFTDQALEPLRSIPTLKWLTLSPGKLSPASITELQQSVPEVFITQ